MKNILQDIVYSGYVMKFNEPDFNGNIIKKEAVNFEQFKQMKIRGDIINYEIDEIGVSIVKKFEFTTEKEQKIQDLQNKKIISSVAIPRISHFVDENGNNVDINADGVNVVLKRDGTHEYFISYGFAGKMQLNPIYVV